MGGTGTKKVRKPGVSRLPASVREGGRAHGEWRNSHRQEIRDWWREARSGMLDEEVALVRDCPRACFAAVSVRGVLGALGQGQEDREANERAGWGRSTLIFAQIVDRDMPT